MLGKNSWEKTAKRLMVTIEFTTRGQSPMRASICFAAITAVLLNKIKEKNTIRVWEKVNIAFSLKQRSNIHTWIFRLKSSLIKWSEQT